MNGNFYRGGEIAEVIMAHEATQRRAKTVGVPECWSLARVGTELASK